MKLLYCKKCGDIFNLSPKEMKHCQCGKSEGKYIDTKNAEYSGPAVPFAIDNYSFVARINESDTSAGNIFYNNMHGKQKIQAWIMKEGNPNFETIKKVKTKRMVSRGCGGFRRK